MVSCGLTAAFLIEPGWQLFFVKFAGCTIKISRWWFQIFFIFIPIWGRFPFWLIFNIFQMGWNHQPDLFCVSPIFPLMRGSWLRPGWVRRVIRMQIVPQCSKRVGSAQYQGGTKSQCDILVTSSNSIYRCMYMLYIYNIYIYGCVCSWRDMFEFRISMDSQEFQPLLTWSWLSRLVCCLALTCYSFSTK